MELFNGNIREHTDVYCVFHVNAASDSARHIYVVNHIHCKIQGCEHSADGGENRPFGPHKAVYIYLVDLHVLHGAGILLEHQHIASHSVFIMADTLSLPDKFSLGINDAAAEQFADQIDDARTAYSHRFLSLVSDNGQSGLHGFLVNHAGFNGSVCSPHSAADVSSLKSRARRAGAAHHEFIVTEHQLPVGTQVNEKRHGRSVPDAAGKGARRNIASHVAADIGSHNHPGMGENMDSQILGVHAGGFKESGNIGLHTNRIRIHSYQQMVHSGIAGYAHTVNHPGFNAGPFAHLYNQGIQRFLYDRILQFLSAARFHGFNDSIDHVRTVPDLTVSGGSLSQNFACPHVHNQGRHRGSTDVHRQSAEFQGLVRRTDIQHLHLILVSADHTLYIKIIFSKRFRHVFHHKKRDLDLLRPACSLDSPGHPLQIRHGILQGRGIHGHSHHVQIIGKFNSCRFYF